MCCIWLWINFGQIKMVFLCPSIEEYNSNTKKLWSLAWTSVLKKALPSRQRQMVVVEGVLGMMTPWGVVTTTSFNPYCPKDYGDSYGSLWIGCWFLPFHQRVPNPQVSRVSNGCTPFDVSKTHVYGWAWWKRVNPACISKAMRPLGWSDIDRSPAITRQKQSSRWGQEHFLGSGTLFCS